MPTSRLPRVTRTHALAIMDSRHDLLLLVDDAELLVTSSATIPARGRIILTRGELLDAEVATTRDGSRFAPGSGEVVDRVLDFVNGALVTGHTAE